MAPKTKLSFKPNTYFQVIFEDLGLFSSLVKLVSPQEVGRNEKNLELEEKNPVSHQPHVLTALP